MKRAALAALAAVVMGPAQLTAQPAATDDLLDLDLIQLLELPVSLASRSEQRSRDAAAAVYVIDRATLRRSGMHRLPDVLRLVPGLHVGKWDANKWAISSRNSMSRFSSTMLLLVDGRPMYTPLFGGVRWETLDLPMDDIERIEVVRGPGGPLWGANAVDAIISIVTRHSADTQGERVHLAFGDGDIDRLAEASTSQMLGGWTWRLGMRWMDSEPGRLPPIGQSAWTAPREIGARANDVGRYRGTMLRVDSPATWAGNALHFSLGHREGDYVDQRLVGGQPRDNSNHFSIDLASVEWRRSLDTGDELVLRSSVNRTVTSDATLYDDQRIVDLDLQHSGTRGRHTWSWGLGLNHYRSDTRTPARTATPPCVACFGADPQLGTDTKRSAFFQNQMQLDPNWTFIFGAKIEDAIGVNWDWQPTLRLRWQPDEANTFWGGWTRALRSSTRLERDGAFFNVPQSLAAAFGCIRFIDGVCQIGNPGQTPWVVEVAEFGWRHQASDALSFDATAFRNEFSGFNQAPGSRVRDRVRGVEVVAQWAPSRQWRADASMTWHQGRDVLSATETRLDTILMPKTRVMLHAQWSPRPDLDLDLRWWREGDRPTASTRIGALEGYDRSDVRVAWRPAKGWETALSIGNANDTLPVEYLEALRVNTAVPRSITLSLRWNSP